MVLLHFGVWGAIATHLKQRHCTLLREMVLGYEDMSDDIATCANKPCLQCIQGLGRHHTKTPICLATPLPRLVNLEAVTRFHQAIHLCMIADPTQDCDVDD